MARIKTMSHDELEALFPDPEARYHLEASTEKEDTIRECMNYAVSAMISRFARFLDTNGYVEDMEYGLQKVKTSVPEAYVVTFTTSERRMQGKEESLKQAMYAYICAKALGEFYLRNGHTELGSKWNSMSIADEETITRIIYRKGAPKLHTYYAPGYYSASSAQDGGKADPELDDSIALYVSR